MTVARRDTGEKTTLRHRRGRRRALDDLLDDIQRALFDDAVAFREANTHAAATYEELSRRARRRRWVRERRAGAARPTCEAKVKAETKATIRFLPLEPEDPGAPCAVCGQPGIERATWAVAY